MGDYYLGTFDRFARSISGSPNSTPGASPAISELDLPTFEGAVKNTLTQSPKQRLTCINCNKAFVSENNEQSQGCENTCFCDIDCRTSYRMSYGLKLVKDCQRCDSLAPGEASLAALGNPLFTSGHWKISDSGNWQPDPNNLMTTL